MLISLMSFSQYVITTVNADTSSEIDNWPEEDAWLNIRLNSWDANQSIEWDNGGGLPDPQFKICVEADSVSLECVNTPTWDDQVSLSNAWNYSINIPDDSNSLNITIECEDNDALNDDECDMNSEFDQWKLFYEYNWSANPIILVNGAGNQEESNSWKSANSSWLLRIGGLDDFDNNQISTYETFDWDDLASVRASYSLEYNGSGLSVGFNTVPNLGDTEFPGYAGMYANIISFTINPSTTFSDGNISEMRLRVSFNNNLRLTSMWSESQGNFQLLDSLSKTDFSHTDSSYFSYIDLVPTIDQFTSNMTIRLFRMLPISETSLSISEVGPFRSTTLNWTASNGTVYPEVFLKESFHIHGSLSGFGSSYDDNPVNKCLNIYMDPDEFTRPISTVYVDSSGTDNIGIFEWFSGDSLQNPILKGIETTGGKLEGYRTLRIAFQPDINVTEGCDRDLNTILGGEYIDIEILVKSRTEMLSNGLTYISDGVSFNGTPHAVIEVKMMRDRLDLAVENEEINFQFQYFSVWENNWVTAHNVSSFTNEQGLAFVKSNFDRESCLLTNTCSREWRVVASYFGSTFFSPVEQGIIFNIDMTAMEKAELESQDTESNSRSNSNSNSRAGTIFAFVILLILAIMTTIRYKRNKPTRNGKMPISRDRQTNTISGQMPVRQPTQQEIMQRLDNERRVAQQQVMQLQKQLTQKSQMTDSQMANLQEELQKMQASIVDSEKAKAELQKKLQESEKGKTIVQNITYNIQDSAISGDINATVNPDNDDD